MRPRQSDPKEPRRGFTRIELLVILATLALLAAVTRPIWASGSATKSLACMDNLRRLSAAWLLYAEDNGGRFVGNYHGGFVPSLTGNERPWVTGWFDWSTDPNNTNTTYLTTPRYAALAPYLDFEAAVFKCPADDYVSRAQMARGWWQRVRSYAMNCAIGEGNYVTGPTNPNVRQVVRRSDFGNISPQQAFVFLDEHPDSINDGLLWVPNSPVNVVDVPGSHHEGAAWFTFADGHLELHPWQTPQLQKPVTALNFINNIAVPADNPDAQWLLDHTPQK